MSRIMSMDSKKDEHTHTFGVQIEGNLTVSNTCTNKTSRNTFLN
jgi:hypothetical protein